MVISSTKSMSLHSSTARRHRAHRRSRRRRAPARPTPPLAPPGRSSPRSPGRDGRTDASAPRASRVSTRNRLRLVPTSTRWPRAARRGIPCSTAQFCAPFLPNPMPGSMITRSAGMPAATAASTRRSSSPTTSATMSSYAAPAYMSAECPRQCWTTSSASVPATAASMSGSASPPDTSLTMRAPASTAASGRRGVHRVDADRRAGGGQRLHDGEHPLLLDRGIHALRSRAGRTLRRRRAARRPGPAAQGRARSPHPRRGSVRRR